MSLWNAVEDWADEARGLRKQLAAAAVRESELVARVVELERLLAQGYELYDSAAKAARPNQGEGVEDDERD